MITLFALLSGICLLIALLGEYRGQQRLRHMAEELRRQQ